MNSSDDMDCQHPLHGDADCAPTPAAQLEAAAELLRALGDPARLRLLERLSAQEHCVSELAAESGEELSTVSQRLKVLRTNRLVTRRRQGKHMLYRLADQHVMELIRNALAHVSEEEDP